MNLTVDKICWLGDRERLWNWRLQELSSSSCPITPHVTLANPTIFQDFPINAINRAH